MFIETPEGNLVAGMEWLQNTYARRFNVRHCPGVKIWFGRHDGREAGRQRMLARLVRRAVEEDTIACTVLVPPDDVRAHDSESSMDRGATGD